MSFTNPVALSTLNGATGFRLDGAAAGDNSGYSVASAGDVNGDGFADVIVGAYLADPNAVSNAGASYVVFGKASGWGSTLDLATLDGSNGFRLNGVAASDVSGRSVASAGDVNGDGFADLVVGAPLADANAAEPGAAYVVFGKAAGWTGSVNLSALDGTNGFRLAGTSDGDVAGSSVASAGDVNGDGFADVIVGAPQADVNGSASGSSYIVFGKAGGWTSSINLSSLNGTTGFRLDGVATVDISGFSVASAGDVNGDGFADIIVGAPQADPGGNANAGSSYVVFGKASGWGASLNLSTLNGTTGFRLDGVGADDRSGFSIASAGDVNGDGFGDIVVGAYQADPNGFDSGASYVVFGKASGWTSTLALSGLNGSNGFRLAGSEQDSSGIAVASAGDLNGDGYADLLVGSYQNDVNGDASGVTHVVFGKASGWGASLDLTDIDGSNGFRLDGVAESDLSGVSVASAGDVDGDGFSDIIIGAYLADPNGDSSGSSYVYFSPMTGGATYRGTTMADRLRGTPADDTMNGNGGNDSLFGAAGNDILNGGAGSDTLDGGAGNDTIDGGLGFDILTYAGAAAGVTLNMLTGTATGGGGNDSFSNVESVIGSAFADSLTGGTGHDRLEGGGGNDTLDGGAGNDVMDGGDGIDTASFASATAALRYGLLAQGSGYIFGGSIKTFSNFENLTGGAFNDTLGGDTGANVVDGNGGDDLLYGWTGDDTVLGGAGNDTLDGGTGNDSLVGAAGNDTYVIDAIGDVVVELAGEGTDSVFVTMNGWTSGANLEGVYLYGTATSVSGHLGADVLVANATTGSLLAGAGGNDVLWGQAGADSLLGGAGDDVIRGGGGNDTLNGGIGDDKLVGGGGADAFQFDAAGWGYDQIFDFVRGTDKLNMAGAAAGYGELTVYELGGSTVVMLGADRIDVYGVVLSSTDFLFV